jgi:bifunctional non-homologous end joining protein LigD
MATARLPAVPAPMLATAGPVPTGVGFAFEFKWDGVRVVAAAGGERVQAMSRNANDITATYPELRVLPELLGAHVAVLDGEVVALDETGRARFDLLQLRMHVQRPLAPLLAQVPVLYVVFDVLHLDGRPLIEEPYEHRRELLAGLDLDNRSGRVRVPSHQTTVDGQRMLEVARAHHLEGVVAKRLRSRYEPGRRSRNWIKTALLNSQEVIIGGWKPGDGRRAGMIGSLLLGAHDPAGRLAYLGKVGTGFTDAMLRDLQELLGPLSRADNPFGTAVPREDAKGVRWVDPRLVGEVEYRVVSPDGRLRHAAWRGLRSDKSPDEVAAPVPD